MKKMAPTLFMYDKFKNCFLTIQQTFKSPLFDYVSSLTLSTLLGTIPLLLLLLFCIYHTPYLNTHQADFEQFFFHPLKISETKEALATIKSNLPIATQFTSSTLVYLCILCAFFAFFIANTLCKITHQNQPIRLGIKMIALILCTMIFATIIPQWGASTLNLLIYKAIFFALLLLTILPDHPTLLILKTVCFTLVAQSILSQLLINFYSTSTAYHLIYGQLAGFIILISWIYFSWAIIAFFLYIHTKRTL